MGERGVGGGKRDHQGRGGASRAEPQRARRASRRDRRQGCRAARQRTLAQAYLEFLYTPEGQTLAAEHYLRPSTPAAAARYADRFPQLELLTIADFGGWAAAQKAHFAEGGVFDQIYRPGS